MTTIMVILVFPVADYDPSMEQRVEAVDVQTLVAESRVERLNISVTPRLAGRNVGQPGPRARPLSDSVGDEFGPVVTAQHHRRPMLGDELLEMFDEPVSGNRSFHKTTQAFTSVLVHDRADLDRFPALSDIELKIDRPHHARRGRFGGVNR